MTANWASRADTPVGRIEPIGGGGVVEPGTDIYESRMERCSPFDRIPPPG
jgi:hypothetical protein